METIEKEVQTTDDIGAFGKKELTYLYRNVGDESRFALTPPVGYEQHCGSNHRSTRLIYFGDNMLVDYADPYKLPPLIDMDTSTYPNGIMKLTNMGILPAVNLSITGNPFIIDDYIDYLVESFSEGERAVVFKLGSILFDPEINLAIVLQDHKMRVLGGDPVYINAYFDIELNWFDFLAGTISVDMSDLISIKDMHPSSIDNAPAPKLGYICHVRVKYGKGGKVIEDHVEVI